MRKLLLTLPLLIWAGTFSPLLLAPQPGRAQDVPQAETTPEAPPVADAAEQARDRSYLTGLIEDNLSGEGMTVRLDGFAGALSSRATFDSLTIADDDGVWLTILDGAISWNRSALLRGRLEIAELSAREVDLPRTPASAAADITASPEAKPFSLPDLPVSVKIEKFEIKKAVLGEALLGEAASLSLSGAMDLANGEGHAELSAERVDAKEGTVSLTASYANATQMLGIDLLVAEGKDGIAARLIGLPGYPALSLAASGTGQIKDFAADIQLSTDGRPRLSGKVTLKEAVAEADPATTTTDSTATPPPAALNFTADLGGDISPLLPAEYQTFFGNSVRLKVEGSRTPEGALSLPVLSIDSAALDLTGAVELNAENLPQSADLQLSIGLPDATEVLLPVSGGYNWIRRAELKLIYDRGTSDNWSLDGRVTGFRSATAKMLSLKLAGLGQLRQGVGLPAALGGILDITASGLEMSDKGLDEALGAFATARGNFSWQEGEDLRLTKLTLIGQGYALNGKLALGGLSEGFDLSGDAEVALSNLAQFSTLAGRQLAGKAEGRIEGSANLLGGAFDVIARVQGNDITVEQPQLDRLLSGQTSILASAKRDETGVTLRDFTVTAPGLSVAAKGRLDSASVNLTANASFDDLSRLDPAYRGGLTAEAKVTTEEGATLATITGTGRSLALGQPELDRLLEGTSDLQIAVEQRGDTITLKNFALGNPQLSAKASGNLTEGARDLSLEARLANAALLAPGFPGPVTVSGKVTQGANGYGVDVQGAGPGGTQAKVNGSVAEDFATANLKITGSAETSLANAFIAPRSVQGPLSFDLALNGAPGLAALSGTVATRNARLVAPTLGLSLDNVTLDATLSGGRAQLSLGGALSSGGTLEISGPVSLTGNYAADLVARLNQLRLRDPELYDTRISGQLTVNGPLTGGARIGGALRLDDTEIRVPSTGLGGTEAIPDITHVGETAAGRATRARAGLLGGDGASGGEAAGPDYPLDISIAAPRIFVRGRGLDAELGGTLRLGGSTSNVVPIGRFELVRGRLDILSKRFTLDEGEVALQGALTPWIRFSASSTNDGYTSTIVIEGDASAPELSFRSTPELPQEEVLSHLLFGHDLTSLSPLQAAQLASAVATLAGKSGEGIVSKLRQNFGLDDLDIGTDDNGNATLKIGKYLSENVYTDVTVGSEGQTEINLNLDISKSIKARGTVADDGSTGIGIYLEKDY